MVGSHKNLYVRDSFSLSQDYCWLLIYHISWDPRYVFMHIDSSFSSDSFYIKISNGGHGIHSMQHQDCSIVGKSTMIPMPRRIETLSVAIEMLALLPCMWGHTRLWSNKKRHVPWLPPTSHLSRKPTCKGLLPAMQHRLVDSYSRPTLDLVPVIKISVQTTTTSTW